MLPGYEGLVHVSELDNKKIASPEAAGFVSGQMIDVKYLGKNDKVILQLMCLLISVSLGVLKRMISLSSGSFGPYFLSLSITSSDPYFFIFS